MVVAPPVGLRDMLVEVVKGRRRRLRKVGIAVKAIKVATISRMRDRGEISRLKAYVLKDRM